MVLFSLCWHAWDVGFRAWPNVQRAEHGRDFASYYYAGRAAQEGLNPWDKHSLSAIAREDGTRRSVHPFLYPPPFVLAITPFTPLTLHSAFKQWFVLTELTALLAMVVLALWWRRHHWAAPAVLFLLLAAVTAVPNNLMMGQANFPVLLLLVAALWADADERQVLAGALLGAACMAKMSPALFVLWWMLHGRWRGVFSAIGTAVLLSIASLAVVDASTQLHFYTHVLPQFASGRYNGLSIPIDLFGNHSIPNLLDQLWPGTKGQLSSTARFVARSITLLLIAGCALGFRNQRAPFQRAAQACAVAVLMLLLPVYTYEHHLVWALPAAAFLPLAVFSGRLHRGFLVLIVFAIVVLAWDLQHLKRLARTVPAVQELKSVSLGVLFGLCLGLGSVKTYYAPFGSTVTIDQHDG